MLPAREAVSLGEGMTPVIHARRLGARMGLEALYVKDEGLNPTGSFKARGLSAAVTRAKELGAKTLAIPTAGNAGGALAGYAAAAGIPCVIVMPSDTPQREHDGVRSVWRGRAEARWIDFRLREICGASTRRRKAGLRFRR